MRKIKLTSFVIVIVVAGFAVLSSCKKKTTSNPTPEDTATGTALDNTIAEQVSADLETMGALVVDYGTLASFKLAQGSLLSPMSGSVSVSVPVSGSYTVTFTNYLGMDGHTRNGILVYSIYPVGSHYSNIDMTLSVTTPTVYTVDNNTVTVNYKNIQNNGLIANGGNMQWTTNSSINITKASANGGGTFNWVESNRIHVLLNTTGTITYNSVSYSAAYNSTNNTINWNNTSSGNQNGAIMQINGSSSGTSTDGVTYNAATSNVIQNHNCLPDNTIRPHFHPFSAGTINFNPVGKTTRFINYGYGNCDLIYTITIGGYMATYNW